MEMKTSTSTSTSSQADSDRDFDALKVGLKHMVETGRMKTIPAMFHNSDFINERRAHIDPTLSIPVIDMGDVGQNSGSVSQKLREACSTWGVFFLVNHGISQSLMYEMLDAVQKFHEQEVEEKRKVYSRDPRKTFKFYSNHGIEEAENQSWADTLECILAPREPNVAEIPEICRDTILRYAYAVKDLGTVLFELFSESLGLDKNHLSDMYCHEGFRLLGHYYPVCPQPQLTLGSERHTDSQFLTILLQDHVGGLQVFHSGTWIDVPCIPGALIVNVGDFLQLVTNDLFTAVYHRVLVNGEKPRKSVACFFGTHYHWLEGLPERNFGPIKELLGDAPPIYPQVTVKDFMMHVYHKKGDRVSPLDYYKLTTRHEDEKDVDICCEQKID